MKDTQLSSNEILAMYAQMRADGQNCIGRFGARPSYISIEEWRDLELAKSGRPKEST